MKKGILVFLIFLLGLDIAVKFAALHWIPPLELFSRGYPFGGIGILPNLFGVTFSLNFVTNSGAAWGFFQGHSGLLFMLRTAIILGIVAYLARNKEASRFPLGLVITGAIGNAIDYALYGHVIDFLHFTFWGYSFPIFNLADSYISIGVCCLLLFSRSQKQMQTL